MRCRVRSERRRRARRRALHWCAHALVLRARTACRRSGGTVAWTTPWNTHKYIDDIESREDGGTPAFTQAIRASLCVALKESMGVARIALRERELASIVWPALLALPNVHVLADAHRERLPIFSFYIDDCH